MQWAKADIVNTFILSKTEIEEINKVLLIYDIPVYNIEELLSFASVKIVTNKKEILYILSIPITLKDACKTFLVKAIKYGNVIDKIEHDNILECQNQLFGIKNQCKKYYDLTICKEDNLIELKDDYCVAKLFRNRVGNCTQVNNEHVPAIEEVGSDIIFLNKYEGTITANEEQVALNGTFLIRHCNVTIEINGKQYSSKEITGNKPLPAFLQQRGSERNIEEVISLEFLKELHVKNTKWLSSLEDKNFTSLGASIFALFWTITITAVAIWRKFRNLPTARQQETKPQAENIKNEVDNTEIKPTTRDLKTSSIYNIHRF
ncbi:uncharacterized protein LOC142231114 [Haematobia irritans]|uniref:uncharacterized protein LOC142231114 n=1 Tax=Haematobia irritans TaxID=7368 RepID=UPI003F4F6D8D